MRACWVLIAVASCNVQTPQPIMSNHAPGWQQHCAPLLEGSVHADATGVDRLVARADDDLRGCWKLAVRIVDAGRPVAPPPSCRALRVSELHLSADWLASCRRFEAGTPQVATRPQPMRRAAAGDRFVGTIIRAGVIRDGDADRDGVPDFRDRCPEEPGDETSIDGCPRGSLREGVALRHAVVLGAIPLQAPAMPPYDLTPAAQTICSAVQDVVAHFAAAPNPTIPLTLAQRWTPDRYDVEWPVESTIAPVEDALRACLAEWTLDTTTDGARSLRWQKARFVVELRTSPERRLAIERR